MEPLKTSSLYEAGYLCAVGCPFPRIVWEKGSAKFFFDDADGLAAWHLEAWRLDHGVEGQELHIPAKKFVNAIHALKRAMNERKDVCVQRNH